MILPKGDGFLTFVTPSKEVKSSGAELPAAMNVAPATSSERSSFSEIASRDGTKKSSQIIATATRVGHFQGWSFDFAFCLLDACSDPNKKLSTEK